ncbi:MAG: AbrB/MazE/SpoVT family DNA-binding domain-containing protein [Acidimicrobiales bacterium]
MTSRVGTKGQVVIPKALRDRLRIVPGDEVSFVLDGDAVRVLPIRRNGSLRGRLAGLPLTEMLMEDRCRERDR